MSAQPLAHPSRRRALVVEDEVPIRDLLRLHLDLAGFTLEETGDGRHALDLARGSAFDLLLLDVRLPGLDGVTLCKVLGLESGADDYLTKPFGVRELMARVGALMRRHRRDTASAQPATTLRAKDLILDSTRRAATVRGEPIELTKQEFDLLHMLAARPGAVFTRAALLQQVWNEDTYVTERTVDTVISRLRRKIERDPQDPEMLLTAWGVGYKFAEHE